jgi:peptide/nickel transport system substrate-binding protein
MDRAVTKTAPVAALLTAMLVAAACGGATSTPTASSSAKPVAGGTLRYLHTMEATSLDPVDATGSSSLGGNAQQFYAVYGGLDYYGLEAGAVVMGEAQSITSPDSKTWTLKLRPGLRFTDGTPFDAAAVKFNWDRIADPANKARTQGAMKAVQSTDVIDSQTLRIALAAPSGQFPYAVAINFPYVASPTAIKANGSKYGTSPQSTVGAGPFTLKDWVRDSEMTLTKNPDYWDKPRPYIDTLVIKPISDINQRLNTLTTGGAQAAVFSTAPAMVAQATSKGYKAYVEPPYETAGMYWQYNTTRAPLNDVRIRKALQEAIDWNAYDQSILNGLPFKLDLFIIRPPSSLSSANAKLPAYNKADAQALFNAYAKDTGGPVQIELNPSQNIANVAEFFQAQLLQYQNVKVTIRQIQSAQALQIYAAKTYMIAGLPINGYDPDSVLYDEYHTGGARNFTGYSNPKMDAALDAGRASTNVKDRAGEYATVQQLLVTDLPGWWIPVDVTTGLTSLATNVQAYHETTGNPLWDKVWVSK